MSLYKKVEGLVRPYSSDEGSLSFNGVLRALRVFISEFMAKDVAIIELRSQCDLNDELKDRGELW